MDKFKKGQVVILKELVVAKELHNIPARIINVTEDWGGDISVRVRFQSPIKIKMGKKVVGGLYTATSKSSDVQFDAIKTLKSMMRSHGKKNTKRSVKKTKASKRNSKAGRFNKSGVTV